MTQIKRIKLLKKAISKITTFSAYTVLVSFTILLLISLIGFSNLSIYGPMNPIITNIYLIVLLRALLFLFFWILHLTILAGIGYAYLYCTNQTD